MEADLIIAGSGFGGSLLALIARRMGFSVVLIEKSAHPRFTIGESTTPLTNLYLEEIAERYDLQQLRPLSKWGRWQRAYPGIPAGLKRGFSFFYHEEGKPFEKDPNHNRQLLVAASPHDGVGDTHWYRPAFDAQLVRWAREEGVQFYDRSRITEARFRADHVSMTFEQKGKSYAVDAKLFVDATGPRGFLFHHLKLEEGDFPLLPRREALYTHFWGVKPFQPHAGGRKENLPYPANDAAVHHLFDGGWIWLLRFNNGITSAGVSLRKDKAEALKLSEGAPAWERLLDRFPGIGDQFKGAEAVLPFRHQSQISFRSQQITGPRWVMLPSSAGFIDPLMSTGFPLNLRGILRLGEMLEEYSDLEKFYDARATYDHATRHELDLATRMVAALWGNLDDFELFSALSLLYFAATSYSESAIRTGKPQLASSFLLDDHPKFGALARQCYRRALEPFSPKEKKDFIREVYAVVRPVDVAGLGDRSRKNWYPVRAEDLLENVDKLYTTREVVVKALRTAGFFED